MTDRPHDRPGHIPPWEERKELRGGRKANHGAASPPVDAGGEQLLTIETLSRQFRVSTKTISRWRKQGLVSRRFVCDGRRRVGFTAHSVERFVRQHEKQVRRSAQFSQMTKEERQGVIAGARHLAEAGHRPAEIIKRLAHETGRSAETIRYNLKQFDRRHPDEAILAGNRGLMAEDTRREIDQRRRRGESVAALAKRFECSEASVRRVLAETRYQRILELPLDYIPNERFDRVGPEEAKAILGPTPPSAGPLRKVRQPSGLPPYLASLYEIPLLNREQEAHLFRKMNYLKHKSSRLLAQLNPTRPSTAVMDQIEKLYEESVATKNELIRANLRLVVSIARRRVGPSEEFFELVSDGNMSLIRAVEKFDFARGFKFSTYATWAIVKNFARTIPSEFQYRSRFRTSRDEMFLTAAENRSNQYAEEAVQSQREHQVAKILESLDEREKQIMSYRFGLGHGREPMTLKQIGNALGVSKERIRQLETRAIAKLRKVVHDEKIEAPEVH